MENEKHIEKVQNLIEKQDFKALSITDKKFVLSMMSEEEYTDQRQVVLAAVSLFKEADEYQPRPLVASSDVHFLATPIPLYKALVGIAAMALLMLLVIPFNKVQWSVKDVKYVTQYDTIETKVIRYDTVEKVIEKPVVKEKIVYVDNAPKTLDLEEAPRLLDVPRDHQFLYFSETTMKNKGTSMKDDTLLFTLPKIF